MDLLCLRRLLDDGIRPSLVLVEVWSPLMHQCGRLEADAIETRRLSYSDLTRLCQYHRDWRSLYLRWFHERFALYSTYATELLRWGAPWFLGAARGDEYTWRGLDAWGWLEIPTYREVGPLPQRQKRITVAQRMYASMGALSSPLTIRADDEDEPLHALLALCRERQIAVAFMLMPDGFHDLYGPAVREGFEAYLDDVCRRYDVPVLDMRTWLDDDGLFDSVHMTHASASAFSARLQAWDLSRITGSQAVARRLDASPRR